ncbi:MAG: sporulation protein YtfJ [Oscillospiraceae bacterium]|jgi:sporulation protein YtfJ|nr:sporulation protein YtfJ [Oscillospiraceae bacterium]
MKEHPVNDMMGSTMDKIKGMIDVNTVVGEPIVTQEVTIIPVSRVSFGFASGGSDFASKHQKPGGENAFGGGSGAGVHLDPIAFLIVRGENVRLLPVMPPCGPIDRAIDVVPEVVDKITNFVEKQQEKKDTSAF